MKGNTSKAAPLKIRAGGVTIPIYQRTYERGGNSYVEFKVAFYAPDGSRRFRGFSEIDTAKEFARDVAGQIARGESKALTLSSEQSAEYVSASKALAGTGFSLAAAIHEFTEAKKILPDHSLVEAARRFHNEVVSTIVKDVAVNQAVDEFLDSKRRLGRSPVHIRDLETRLRRFARSFSCSLATVTQERILDWLMNLAVDKTVLSGRSRNNYLAAIGALVDFGRKKQWTTLNVSEIERFAETTNEVAIFSVQEWEKLLRSAKSDLVPFLGLGGFAGIRSAEIVRMTWGQIRFEQEAHFPNGWIELRASQSKNSAKLGARARRLVPMQANLAACLAPLRKGVDEPVCSMARPEDHLRMLAKKAGIPWKRNGPRHSYGSYRLAQIHDENKVALEMGNSPQMIFAHYRQIVTPAQAEAWFNIVR